MGLWEVLVPWANVLQIFVLDGHFAGQPDDGIPRIEVPIARHDKDNAS